MKKQIPERFHPGEYIKEEMKARDMSFTELALAMNLRPRNLGALLRERDSVDRDIAKRLQQAFGISAKFWLNLQAAYDEGETNEEG